MTIPGIVASSATDWHEWPLTSHPSPTTRFLLEKKTISKSHLASSANFSDDLRTGGAVSAAVNQLGTVNLMTSGRMPDLVPLEKGVWL